MSLPMFVVRSYLSYALLGLLMTVDMQLLRFTIANGHLRTWMVDRRWLWTPVVLRSLLAG